MTNQLKRSLAMVLTMALLMGVMILTGAASATSEAAGATALGIDAAAAVPQEDAQDTALYATGDVDNNDEINASDALTVLQYSVQLRQLNKAENRAADANGDGLINASDALLILQHSVKLIDGFEVDKVDDDTEDPVILTEKLAPYTGTEYYFDNFKTAKKLYVVGGAGSALSTQERFCALALQGIVAGKGESQIAVVYDFDSYNTWLKELQETYGIELVTVKGLWELVDQFKSYITDSHYVTYTYFDENNPTAGTSGELASYANACTIAGQEGWLPIDSKLEEKAKAAGLTAGTKTAFSALEMGEVSLGNASNFEEWDLADYYGWGEGKLNQDMMIMLGARDYNMRDVGIANGCLFFTNNGERNYESLVEKLNRNAVILGWVDSDGVSEVINLDNPIVATLSQKGIVVVPTDHANNISVYAGLEKSNFKQTPSLSNARTDTDKVHYVTLIMEGGTSYSHVERGFVQTQAHLPFTYWNNASRGTIPMGWTLTPMMTDMSPLILNYLYKTATVNDQFVASLSGIGYNYSNILGTDMEDLTAAPAVRTEHYKRTGEYMQAANMEYITIMESAPIEDAETRATQLSYYSDPDSIKGGFMYYLNGTGYVTNNSSLPGAVYWSNNKPFVNLRSALSYTGITTTLAAYKDNGNIGTKPQAERNELLQQMAWTLNNRAKDATTIDGYSAINVYQWAFSYEDCVTLSKMLDEDVVLVTPGEFLQLISKKVEKKNALVSSEPTMGEEDVLPEIPGAGLAEKDTALAMAATKDTLFDFDATKGTQGWSLVVGEGDKDNAYFSENSKTKALQINLTGTKVDSEDDTARTPNSMAYNKIAVPSSAKTLALTTGSASSADIRLLAVDAEGNETVIMGTKSVKNEEGETVDEETEWVRVANNKTTEWDISSISGKNTVLYIQLSGSSVRITSIEIL